MRDQVRILLVDDIEDNLVALEAVLRTPDYQLVRAGSGEQAMKALLREEFAVVLLDLLMPGMDGFETSLNIRRHDQTKDTPIILLTAANAGVDYAFRGYASGASDYLVKPFDPWVLRAKVAFFVELYRKNLALQSTTQGLAEVGALLVGLEAELRRGALEPDEVLARVAAAVRRFRCAVGRGPVAPAVPQG